MDAGTTRVKINSAAFAPPKTLERAMADLGRKARLATGHAGPPVDPAELEAPSEGLQGSHDRPSPPLSPRLADVQPHLSEWMASIMNHADDVLATMGDDHWTPGTRKVVVDYICSEAITAFVDDTEALHITDPAVAQARATRHLACSVIYRAREQHLRAARA